MLKLHVIRQLLWQVHDVSLCADECMHHVAYKCVKERMCGHVTNPFRAVIEYKQSRVKTSSKLTNLNYIKKINSIVVNKGRIHGDIREIF